MSQPDVSYNYNSFLDAIRESNPLACKAENSRAYGQSLFNAARGNYDPLLSAGMESKQFNSSNYYTFGNAELKQPLFTAQYLKVGYQYGQGVYLNPEKNTPSAGLPYIGLEASLLQGLMFDKRRAEFIKAGHYADYFTAEQKIQFNELLFAASNTYVEALFTKKMNGLYAYFTNLADQRLKGVADLSAIGERPSVDTIEAAILYQGRLLDKQAVSMELVKKLNELSVLNPMTGQVALSASHLSDSLESVYLSVLKQVQQAMIFEGSNNPIISQYVSRQKILEAEKRLKREMIKPVLDLNYNFLNTPNTLNYAGFNANAYKWGANFSFPLFLRKPRNEYKMSALEVKNNELETANKQNQLTFKRKYLQEAIHIVAGQISHAERSLTYSKLLLEAERLKFTGGESSLFMLNSRENKWLDAEVKLAEYKLKFIKLFMELTYINGSLNYQLPG
ncbi:MAG: TolC family protein [Bacteroidetes bacterium]|nr:TolC family protein [Bacteroidota bacterium]